MTNFIFGMLVGNLIGIVLLSLCAAAKTADDHTSKEGLND